jgi:paraquat-inducible protein B
MRTTMEKMNNTMSTDSGIGYQMQEALSNLSEATEALRVLIESLERNPGMFIRGKEEPEPTNEQ